MNRLTNLIPVVPGLTMLDEVAAVILNTDEMEVDGPAPSANRQSPGSSPGSSPKKLVFSPGDGGGVGASPPRLRGEGSGSSGVAEARGEGGAAGGAKTGGKALDVKVWRIPDPQPRVQ